MDWGGKWLGKGWRWGRKWVVGGRWVWEVDGLGRGRWVWRGDGLKALRECIYPPSEFVTAFMGLGREMD